MNRNGLAIPEGAIKKWFTKKNELAFVEGAVKKGSASLEMCWHFQKELLNKYLQA